MWPVPRGLENPPPRCTERKASEPWPDSPHSDASTGFSFVRKTSSSPWRLQLCGEGHSGGCAAWDLLSFARLHLRPMAPSQRLSCASGFLFCWDHPPSQVRSGIRSSAYTASRFFYSLGYTAILCRRPFLVGNMALVGLLLGNQLFMPLVCVFVCSPHCRLKTSPILIFPAWLYLIWNVFVYRNRMAVVPVFPSCPCCDVDYFAIYQLLRQVEHHQHLWYCQLWPVSRLFPSIGSTVLSGNLISRWYYFPVSVMPSIVWCYPPAAVPVELQNGCQ